VLSFIFNQSGLRNISSFLVAITTLTLLYKYL
jgi:hypothetical protein